MSKTEIEKKLKELAEAVRNEGLQSEKDLREDVLKKLRNSDENEKLKRIVLLAGLWSLKGANKRELYEEHLFKNIKWTSSDHELEQEIMHSPFKGLSKNRIMNFFKLMQSSLGVNNPTDALKDKLKAPKVFYDELINLSQKHKNVGTFTVRAFFKILHLQGEYEFDKILPVPLGQNIERAIQELTGYDGSKKAFDELAQNIHKKFASISDTDIYVINGGLWEYGSFDVL